MVQINLKNKVAATLIIPTHNRAASLNRCLFSISKSKYKNFNVIVSDDASTDATKKVINNFKNKIKLRYVYNPIKSNANYARNSALRKSDGRIVIFLDSDDEISPERIGSVVKCHQNYGCDILVTNFSTINKKLFSSFNFNCNILDKLNKPYLLLAHAFPITFSSISATKNSIIKMDYLDQFMFRHQDRDFLLSCFKFELKIKFKNLPGVFKNQSSDSFSRSELGYIKSLDNILNKHKKNFIALDRQIVDYLVLRTFIKSFSRFDIDNFSLNLKDLINSRFLSFYSLSRFQNYFLGRAKRKSLEKKAVKYNQLFVS